MTGRIVVGIDGSEHSAAALEWAVARARLGGEELALVNAYSPPATYDFYGFHGFGSHQPETWVGDSSQGLLEAAQQHLAAAAPEITTTTTSEMGPAAFVLGTASAGAEAIVVGRRGLGAAGSALLGSVSNRLTVESQAPLIVVTEGVAPSTGPVVVGVDDSAFGVAALHFALAEAALRGTSVRAVTAYTLADLDSATDPEMLRRMRAEVEAEAADVIARALAALGPAATAVPVERVTVEGRAAEAIVSHAADAQLIVVGSHGKGLVRRVLLGSVSRQILHDADRPVAIVDVPEA